MRLRFRPLINPDAFDDPNTLAGFVDAMRWGAVTSADDRSLQAPFHSGVAVEAYQLEPLRRALSAPRTNLLLADDVGLGKTVEAGLVVQELLLRHRARTAIVVCPPSLALKWQDEMRDKFGLDFTIVNSEMMRDVRRRYGLHANPLRLYPRVIVSMAWLPQVRAQRMLRDVYAQAANTGTARRYAFDILIVDEAHHVAPASPPAVGGGRGYAVDTQRTIAVRELADKCEHRLFLSATPHNGHKATAGRKDLVYVHLGHPLVKKAQRLLRRSLWSADAPLQTPGQRLATSRLVAARLPECA